MPVDNEVGRGIIIIIIILFTAGKRHVEKSEFQVAKHANCCHPRVPPASPHPTSHLSPLQSPPLTGSDVTPPSSRSRTLTRN